MASVPEDLIVMLDPLVSETAGTNLLKGPPPELPTDLVVLSHYGGEPAEDRVMGVSRTPPGVEISMVQLYVRNALEATAKSKADTYHALLDNFDGTISGRRYFQIESVDSAPHSLGQDNRGLWMAVANYRCQHSR